MCWRPIPYQYANYADRHPPRPERRAEDRQFGDHRPMTPAYIRPACTTNPQNHFVVHYIKATGFVDYSGAGLPTKAEGSPKGVRKHVFSDARAGLTALSVYLGPFYVLTPLCRCSGDRPEPSPGQRSEEHTSELQSLMRISYAVFCLKKK